MIHLEQDDGSEIKCEVSPEIAEQLRDTGKIAALRIARVLPDVEIPITEAFCLLAEAVGPGPWVNPEKDDEEEVE